MIPVLISEGTCHLVRLQRQWQRRKANINLPKGNFVGTVPCALRLFAVRLAPLNVGNYSEGGYRTSERPSDGKRMTIEDGNKSSEQRMTLLAHSRKVGAYETKAGSSLFGSERARNLLLDFCHPQIAFGLVVRKWQRKVIEESQHLIGSM